MIRKTNRFTNYTIITIICLICVTYVAFKRTERVRFIPPLIEKMVVVKSYECADKTAPRTIPKIIHQVWNDDILPAEFIANVRSLVRDNPYPEWQYYFWTREAATKLFMDKYPYLLQRYNNESATCNTMRADMVRIVALHEFGGVYFDLDTISVRSLNSFVENHECSLALEPGEHFFGQKMEFLLTNSALFCRAKHPFFKHLLYRLSTLTHDCVNPFLCTGPRMLTPLYKEINRTNGDTIPLPEVQSSRLFQDVYDVKGQQRMILSKCSNVTEAKLSPFFLKVCKEWEERGRENRTLSDLAYTYHTWFHVYGKKLEESPTNNIFNIIPHAKVYGVNV